MPILMQCVFGISNGAFSNLKRNNFFLKICPELLWFWLDLEVEMKEIAQDVLAYRMALLEWDGLCNDRYGESKRSAKEAFFASKSLEKHLVNRGAVRILRTVKVG